MLFFFQFAFSQNYKFIYDEREKTEAMWEEDRAKEELSMIEVFFKSSMEGKHIKICAYKHNSADSSIIFDKKIICNNKLCDSVKVEFAKPIIIYINNTRILCYHEVYRYLFIYEEGNQFILKYSNYMQ